MSDKKDLTSIVELPPMDAADMSVEPMETIKQPNLAAFDIAEFAPMESMELSEAPPETIQETLNAEPHHPEAVSFDAPMELAPEQPSEQASPVIAAPAGASQTHELGQAPERPQNFEEVKKYAEQLPIGTPHVEANPPFSVLLSMHAEHPFSEKAAKALENALASDDFGIRYNDVKVQLTGSKILIPRISEFAAVTLAQKMRDTVDNVALGLAEEIYQSDTLATDGESKIMLSESEVFHQHREEVRDLAAEPRAMNELFSTNLNELSGYKITRILSALTASELLDAKIAENTGSREFERATNRVTRDLLDRAFRLGAHGIVGLTFSLKPTAETVQRYRLMGTCTAVRAQKTAN